jgi:hypothetical protein
MLLTAGCGGSSKAGTTNVASTNPGSTSTVSTNTGSTSTTASTTASTTGSNSGGSGKALTASQLVAKADAICGRANSELEVAEKNKVRTQQDVVRVAPERAGIERTAVTELSKLTPPASMSQDWNQIIAARKTLIEELTKLGEDAAAGNTKAEESLFTSSATVQRQLAAAAQRSGFKHCGQVS